MRTARPVYGIC